MSLRSKHSGHPGKYSSSGGFSSRSMGSFSTTRSQRQSVLSLPGHSTITPVTVNKSLLTPVNVDIDPAIQTVRTREKDQIKGLNNRFATFIDKVQFLEQENQRLKTKWNLLDQQTAATSNVEPMLKAYIADLQRQLDSITNAKDRLDMENSAMHKSVEDFKSKYEVEINKRNGAENEFVLLKKDVDSGYLAGVDLEDRVSGLADEIHFLRQLYDEEMRELEESLKEVSVVVQMDNSRALNMDQIVSEVKLQYEGIAARSREESERWYKSKFDQVAWQADQYNSEMHSTKAEIDELKRLINRLQNEVLTVKGQCDHVEGQILAADECGKKALKDASKLELKVQQAIQAAKKELTDQVRKYQELMNVKLALDIEISTYRKLLEGEEDRFGQQCITNVQTVQNSRPTYVAKQTPVLIKTVETHNNSIVYS